MIVLYKTPLCNTDAFLQLHLGVGAPEPSGSVGGCCGAATEASPPLHQPIGMSWNLTEFDGIS